MEKAFQLISEPVLRLLVVTISVTLLHSTVLAQHRTSLQLYDELIRIEKDPDLSANDALKKVVVLQKEFDKSKLLHDSVYARILHRSGALCFSAGKLNDAIDNTLQSVVINLSGKKASNPTFAVRSYSNLGAYNLYLRRYREALKYYDSCTILGIKYKDPSLSPYIAEAKFRRGSIFYAAGDYQKAIEECTLGLSTAILLHDANLTVRILTDRAQSYAALKLFNKAIADINKASTLIENNDYNAYANNYKVRAIISAANNNYAEAIGYQKKGIAMRGKTGDTAAIAMDYLDAGNTLKLERIAANANDFSRARSYYSQSLTFALKAGDNVTAALAFNNLATLSFRTKKYGTALTEYQNSLIQTIPSFKSTNTVINPTYRECNAINDKNFLSLLLGNKAECLLYLYNQTGDKRLLSSSIRTALLTDSLITDMRHEQTGEQSKLYWRDRTREFFTNAIEACYQAKDQRLAFFFMERSRAVLLNDKLNELGASAYLPAEETHKEQAMQINVLALQQQLTQLADTDPAYEKKQVKLLEAKEDLDNYIKTLQDKYPSYYQYKYADDVPELKAVQKYLGDNKQSFVHYFITDTTIFMLGLTGSSSHLIKLYRQHFNDELGRFLRICSDKQSLNNFYNSFASLSHNIYETLFKPLLLAPGRVIICYDNFLIPFEALATDDKGAKFLIADYSFTYIYSATFLLRHFNNSASKGNFLGVAPVSYAGYLHVPQLVRSAESIHSSASNFHTLKLITNSEANRRNFLSLLPDYTVVTVLSHARADSTDKEPILFMTDSVIGLSELQLLRNPSTQLVVLSACQTNAGKIATGEGVISLARGFASAGIPSISATLWKADEEAIYTITEAFLRNISKGMRKDDALQKAKLSFMQMGGNEKLLPFYWANMILAGNGEPVLLAPDNYSILRAAGVIIIAAFLLFFIALLLYRTAKKAKVEKQTVYLN